MKLFICALFLTLLPTTAKWLTDFEKAKTEAVQSKKNILISFSGSDWCVPCRKMKNTIFNSNEFAQFAENQLVLLNADFPRLKKNLPSKAQIQQNEALAERYNPQGSFPYTVLVDAQGRILKTWDGMPKSNPNTFIQEIRSASK
jgi:thiol-disulfide isomerase/thioredoxin